MGGIIEHPVHVHTNPFQIVSLLPDYLAPGTTYSNWFQVSSQGCDALLPGSASTRDRPAPCLPACLPAPRAQVGDWHDTLQMPMLAQPSIFLSSTVGLRFQPGPYAGYSVMHCHVSGSGAQALRRWERARGMV